MLSTVATLFYILTSSVQEFELFHILKHISLFCLFVFFFWNNRHANGYELVSHCGFYLHFSND